MFEKKCTNGGNHHKFEPRYDEVPSNINLKKIQYFELEEVRKILILNVYVKDVCIWCGKEIKK